MPLSSPPRVPVGAVVVAAASPVPRPWLRGATLAAAATLGALVGFGVRDGASLARLGVVTLRLRGLPEFVLPDRGAVGPALLGGAHASLVSGAWGAAAAVAAGWLRRRGVRGWRLAAALAGAAAVVAAVDSTFPSVARLAAGTLHPAELVLTAALVVAGGAAGSSLARLRADDGSGAG